MEIIKYDSKKLDQIVRKIVKILKRGGVVVIPTDTCYGLLAEATNEEAVRKVFYVKKRPFDRPVSVFLSSKEDVYKYAEVDKLGEKFLNLLPARLTLIFKARVKLPEPMIVKDGKIGIRVVEHMLPTLIVKNLRSPVTATSANIHGKPPAYSLDELKNLEVDLIVDAGELPRVPPSTVIDLTQRPPIVLREGAISVNELERKLGIKLRRKQGTLLLMILHL